MGRDTAEGGSSRGVDKIAQIVYLCFVDIIKTNLKPLDSSFTERINVTPNSKGNPRLTVTYSKEDSVVAQISSSWITDKNICGIHGLYVDPEIRSMELVQHLLQGVFKQMIKRCIATAVGYVEPYEVDENGQPNRATENRKKALARLYASIDNFEVDAKNIVRIDLSSYIAQRVDKTLED